MKLSKHVISALTISLISLSANGCKWDSSSYDQFVDDDGSQAVVSACQNKDGYLDAIEFRDKDNNVLTLCSYDKNNGKYTCDPDVKDTDFEETKAFKSMEDAFNHNLCPAEYSCLDENNTPIDVNNPPAKVHCGIPVQVIIQCDSVSIACKDLVNDETEEGETITQVCITPNDEKTCGIACQNGFVDKTHSKKCIDDAACNNGVCTCSEDLVICEKDGIVSCKNPSSNESCGITSSSCSAPIKCPEHSECQFDTAGEAYRCVCINGYVTKYENGKTICVNPANNETCGAKINEIEGVNCKNLTNGEYNCQIKADGGYGCVLIGCKGDDNYCYDDKGLPKCIPANDDHNCGKCGNNCVDATYVGASPTGKCAWDENSKTNRCTFTCEKSQNNSINITNCGSEFEPNCIDTNHSTSNCRACGNNCHVGDYCDANIGCKQDNNCNVDQCNWYGICIKDADSSYNNYCGPDCLDCTKDGAKCVNGECVATECPENSHIRYDDKGKFWGCEVNSVEKCAIKNNASNDKIKNCL